MAKIKVTRYRFKNPPQGGIVRHSVTVVTVDNIPLVGVQSVDLTIDSKTQGGILTIKTLEYDFVDLEVERDYKIPDVRTN